MSNVINFQSKYYEAKELSEEKCNEICANPGPEGFFQSVMKFTPEEIKNLTEEQKQMCLDYIIDGGYATCGRKNQIDEEVNLKTDEYMKKMKTFGYVQFKLKKIKSNDGESICGLQGWNQGKDDSDCWLDSFLFAIFANNNIANLLLDKMHSMYLDTKIEDKLQKEKNELDDIAVAIYQYTNNILFCINLYLNLISELKHKMDDAKMNLKNELKWCIVWYILKYYEIGIDSETYDTMKNSIKIDKINLKVNNGGNPIFISYFFSTLFPEVSCLMEKEGFSNTDELNALLDEANALTESSIVFVPTIAKLSAKEEYFSYLPKIKRYKQLNLEAIIIGADNHATTYTLCNNKWRYYNNLSKGSTTVFVSNERATNEINNLLNHKTPNLQFCVFVYKRMKQVGGKTKKQRKTCRVRGYSRKHRR